MKLILVRHAIAVAREEFQSTGHEDSLRPLTPKGVDRFKKVVQALKQREPELDCVVSSPYLRAKQTAEILAKAYRQDVLESMELIPSAPPMAFSHWLQRYSQGARVIAAVGHEPHLSTFASWLLSGTERSFLDLKKGGILCLGVESFESLSAKNSELHYLLQPKFFC